MLSRKNTRRLRGAIAGTVALVIVMGAAVDNATAQCDSLTGTCPINYRSKGGADWHHGLDDGFDRFDSMSGREFHGRFDSSDDYGAFRNDFGRSDLDFGHSRNELEDLFLRDREPRRSRDDDDFRDLYPSRLDDGFSTRFRPRYDDLRLDDYDRIPSFEDRMRERDERDRYEPIPRRRSDEEKSLNERINERITARYSNPVNVRFARSMSADRGLRVFSEISRMIDARHLKPTSYSSRVRRALQHLSIGVGNRTFRSATGLSASGFRIDSFRNELSRMMSATSVRNGNDAASVLRTAMSVANRTTGLSPGVVAYEFINASTDSLDKYSAFEPNSTPTVSGAVDPILEKTVGPLDDHVVGIGVEVKQHDDGLLIVKTLAGGPAREAGLRKGDVIVSINGRSLSGRPMGYSVDLISGAEGTPVLMGVRRGNRSEASITLRRRRVRVLSVNDVRMVDRTVGYLKLDKFANGSSSEMDKALWNLHRQGMKSLIIDVRGNPGGLLTSAIEISNKFVPCGTIVSTRGRLNSDNMLERATFERTWKTPLVVLTDGDSASASEIFAAAVQENGRGVVVGDRSYGKGTVQTHFPLGSGSGNLRLTTARFFSPNGRAMAEAGVTPDVRVSDPDGEENGDRVLARAVSVARHPKLAEMATSSGGCKIRNNNFGRTGNLDTTESKSAGIISD